MLLFANSNNLQSQFLGLTPYDHELFAEAAQSVSVEIIDETTKIAAMTAAIDPSYFAAANVSGLLLDHSLEAHTTTVGDVKYWILEGGYRPQKRYRHALADVVFDGEGFSNFLWQPNWDKYNFFRFHNLNSYSITVTFPNGHTLTIPRWECRATRRDYDSGVFTDGWNYLNRQLAGDYRIFEITQGNDNPARSAGANNVCSPSILYRVFETFRGTYGLGGSSDIPGPKLHLDPHQVYDVSSLYSGYYPSITDQTILGDLLHHRGDIIDKRVDSGGEVTTTRIPFRGYADAKARWPAIGITIAENADGTITFGSSDAGAVTHDLWGIGSNLFHRSADHRPGVDLKVGADIDNHGPSVAANRIYPVVGRSTTQSFSWYPLSEIDEDGFIFLGEANNGTLPINYVRYLGPTEGTFSGTWSMHADTVASVTSLDKFGAAEYPGQSTIYGTVENRSLTLTPFGLTLRWSTRIPLAQRCNYPYTGSDGFARIFDGSEIDATLDSGLELDGIDLIVNRSITFDGYGWPTTQNPAFVSPRVERRLKVLPEKHVTVFDIGTGDAEIFGPYRHHPDVTDEPFGPDGADSRVIPLVGSDKDSEKVGIRVLAPLQLSDSHVVGGSTPFDRQIYANPDTLQDLIETPETAYVAARDRLLQNRNNTYRRVRLTALREHYNALANHINAYTKCRPFTFANFRIPFEGSLRTLRPNSFGPYSGPIYPANQFSKVEKDSEEHRLYIALGIPVLTEADLPSSYLTIRNTDNSYALTVVRFQEAVSLFSQRDVVDQFGITRRTYRYQVEQTVVDTQTTLQNSDGTIVDHYTFDGLETELIDYRWVKVDDVKSAAEALGFKFHLQRFTVPLRLELFEFRIEAIRHITNDNYVSFVEESVIEQWNGLNPDGSANITFPPPTVGTAIYSSATPLNPVGGVAAFVECISGETAEWVRDATLPRLRDYRAGDVLVLNYGSLNSREGDTRNVAVFQTSVIVEFEYRIQGQADSSLRYLRRALYPRFGSAENKVPLLHNLPTWTENRRPGSNSDGTTLTPSLLFQDYVSAGIDHSSKLVLVPVPTIEHSTETFSRESYQKAFGRLSHGPIVIPLAVNSAGGGVVETEDLIASQNMVFAPTGYAADAILFRDWPVSL